MIEVINPFNFWLAWIAFLSSCYLYYTEQKHVDWFATIAIFNLLLSIIKY